MDKFIKIKNQKGVVSLVVTLMLITVMAIIVLAFGSFTRREERQAVERQLGTEAFYAAEAGINDAISVLRNTPVNTGLHVNDKTTCENTSDTTFTQTLDGTDNVKYSCLLIYNPESLEYKNLEKGESKIIPIDKGPSNANITSLSLYWHDPDSTGTTFSSCPDGANLSRLPSTWPGVGPASNCNAGMLRVEIVPVSKSSALTTATLEGQSKVVFLKPSDTTTDATVGYSGINSGDILSRRCTGPLEAIRPKYCKFTINGLNSNRFFLRVTPLYRNATLTICSPDCALPSSQTLYNAQKVIDSTGKASDIVRRLQVRVGVSGFDGPFPNYAIESGESVCKQLTIVPPDIASDSSGCSLP